MADAHQIDVSGASDEVLLDLLRQRMDLYKAEKLARGLLDELPVNAHLAELDPSELPSCFLMSGDIVKTMELRQGNGSWGHKTGSFTAIRWSTEDPEYIGVKKRMEFRERNGAKSDWVMIQYHLLEPKNEGPDLFLQDELMLCVVFRLKNEGEVLSPDQAIRPQISDSPGYISGTSMPAELDTDGPLPPVLEEFNIENQLHGVGLQPRFARTSDVWTDFTKIHAKNDGYKLAYAVCHICDKLLKAPSNNGIATLWRHYEKCSCQHLGQQTQ